MKQFKTLTAASVLNVTSSYLLSDFSRANFSIAISAFLNIPDGSPANFNLILQHNDVFLDGKTSILSVRENVTFFSFSTKKLYYCTSRSASSLKSTLTGVFFIFSHPWGSPLLRPKKKPPWLTGFPIQRGSR